MTAPSDLPPLPDAPPPEPWEVDAPPAPAAARATRRPRRTTAPTDGATALRMVPAPTPEAAPAGGGQGPPLREVGTLVPIPAMKGGWLYRESDRTVFYERMRKTPEGLTTTTLETVGHVPPVTGWVTRRMEDGRHTTAGYRLDTPEGSRVVSNDELDNGAWAEMAGEHKPSGRDAIQAFATVIRMEGRKAPEAPGVPYVAKDGGLIIPDASSQEIGYRVLAGEEEDAREAWREIAACALAHPLTLLALGAVYCGPLVATFDVPAHILNLVGVKQTGKSTTQAVQAGLLGASRGYGIFQAWNSSPQGIPQTLKQARFLPMVREEHSTMGLPLAQSERLLSQIVGGADRATGGRDGSVRTSLGRWHSILSSSSNAPLRRTGQTEDLGSRLYEIHSPFWSGWQEADRVEELTHAHHGWPLEWAVREGVFTAEGIARWRGVHREVTGRLAPEGGGFGRTIAKTHAAWVTGAAMLGEVLEVDGLMEAAEGIARELLPGAIVSAGAATVPAGQALWDALDGARVVLAEFPEAGTLPAVMGSSETRVKVRGYVRPQERELWVLPDALATIARDAGIENLSACIDDLKRHNVLVPGDGRNDRRQLVPRSLRTVDSLPKRMWCFNIGRGKDAFDPDPEEGPDQDPGGDSAGTNGGLPLCSVCREPMKVLTPGQTMHPMCEPEDSSGFGAGSIGAEAWAQTLMDEPEEEVPAPVATIPAPRVNEHQEQEVPQAAAPAPARSVQAYGVLTEDGALILADGSRAVLPAGFLASVQHVGDLAELLTAHAVKAVHVPATVAALLGLPERIGAGTWATGAEDHPFVDQARAGGWDVHPQGLAAWMTVFRDGVKGDGGHVVFDAWDGDAEAWQTAGAEHVAATLSLVRREVGVDYFRTPQTTMGRLVASVERKHYRTPGLIAIESPPVRHQLSGIYAPPVASGIALEGMFLHLYDVNKQYASACRGLDLATAPYEHQDRPEVPRYPLPGFWRLRIDITQLRPRATLRPVVDTARMKGRVWEGWVPTPTLVVLRDAKRQFDVLEAWVSPSKRRFLDEPMGIVTDSVARLRAASAGDGDPEHTASVILKTGYASWVNGTLRSDFNGARREGDRWYRPDVTAMVQAQADARKARLLIAAYDVAPVRIITDETDAIVVLSADPDASTAVPGLALDRAANGKFKHEGSMPVTPAMEKLLRNSKRLASGRCVDIKLAIKEFGVTDNGA